MTSRRHLFGWLVLGLALWAGTAGGQAEPNASGYRIIVNLQNPQNSVERRFLSQAFLKRLSNWGHGDPIRPVDLPSDSPVRRRFSDEVHNRSVAAVRSYWQQVIFSGRGVPPPELESDQAVLRYVARHPGGIGYVSGATDVGAVKVLSVR